MVTESTRTVGEQPPAQQGWLAWVKALLSYPNGLALAVVIIAGHRWVSLPLTEEKRPTEIIALAVVILGALATSVLNQWVCDCRLSTPPTPSHTEPTPPVQQPTTIVVQAAPAPAPVVVQSPVPPAPTGNGGTQPSYP